MSTPVLGFGTTAPADPMPVTAGYGMQFWNQWAKYFVARDPQISPFAIDPADAGEVAAPDQRADCAPGRQRRRPAPVRPLRRQADPGPRRRRRAGQPPLHDRLLPARPAGDGQAGDQGFSRFYLVPGANHANFAPVAFSASYDSLTALEKWAERGVAPGENQVVADGNAGAGRPGRCANGRPGPRTSVAPPRRRAASGATSEGLPPDLSSPSIEMVSLSLMSVSRTKSIEQSLAMPKPEFKLRGG